MRLWFLIFILTIKMMSLKDALNLIKFDHIESSKPCSKPWPTFWRKVIAIIVAINIKYVPKQEPDI